MNSTIISRDIEPVSAGSVRKSFVLFLLLLLLSPLLNASDRFFSRDTTVFPVLFNSQIAFATQETSPSIGFHPSAGFSAVTVLIAVLIGNLFVIAFFVTRRLRRNQRRGWDQEPQVSQMIQSAPFAFFQILTSVQGQFRVLYVNPTFEKTIGICLDELKAGIDHFWDLIHPDDRDLFRNQLSICNSLSTPIQMQLRIRAIETYDSFKVFMVADPLKDGQILWNGFLRDDTQAMRNRKQLQEMIENNPNPIQIVDKEGRTQTINTSFRRLFGTVPSLGDSVFSMLEGQFPQYRKLICKAKQGEVVHFPDIDYSVCLSVDQPFKSPLWIRTVIFPLKDSEDRSECFVLMYEDVSQRKEIENQYRSLFENTGSGIIVIEEDTTISLANEQFAKSLAFSREEIENRMRWTELAYEEDLAMMQEQHNLRRKDPTQAKTNYEFRFRNRNGELRDFLTYVSMIPGTKKSIASLIDITERKQAERALMESQEQNRRQQGKFQKDLLLSIIQILELYDLYTRGHSENVARYSALIAEKIKPDPEWIRRVYWAGLVHDIGKLLVPTHVLNKVNRLTEQEFELIKMHPIWGAKVLNTSEQLSDIGQYVLHHHERYDGQGYPDGLSGKEIPLASRIIAVADAFDAMTCERAYRKPFSDEEACSELKKSSGAQFDPEIVDMFITLKLPIERDQDQGTGS